MMNPSSSSLWSILPVEIQLAITHHLDTKTLLSLSLVSRHNYTLCLPAIYNVRCPAARLPSSIYDADRSYPSRLP